MNVSPSERPAEPLLIRTATDRSRSAFGRFGEPLVAVGPARTRADDEAIAAALLEYPDDVLSLDRFMEDHRDSPWRAALLASLAVEHFNAGRYSKALESWASCWQLAEAATGSLGKALADRAVGELAYMYARLGRMIELEALLRSVEGTAVPEAMISGPPISPSIAMPRGTRPDRYIR